MQNRMHRLDKLRCFLLKENHTSHALLGDLNSMSHAMFKRLLGFRLMSSPARSSASGTSAGLGGGGPSSSNAGLSDDAVYHFPADLISVHDRKEAALSVLRSDLMAALQKEVKSLDEDNWMFSGPRSQIHLVLRPGSHPHMQSVKHREVNQFKQQIR